MIEPFLLGASAGRLRRRGVITTAVRSVLGRDREQRFSAEAAAMIRRLNAADLNAAHVAPGPARSAIFDFGLHPSLMEVIRRAMRTRHLLVAAHVRHDDARQLPGHLKSWHLDAEDRRMIRMIVYLVDVGINDAALEVVPGAGRLEELRDRSEGDEVSNPLYRPVSDQELAALVPPEEWSIIDGPALMVVAAATGLVLHRVRPGTGRRWTLTFTYLPLTPGSAGGADAPSWLTPSERAVYGIATASSSTVLPQP